MRTSEFVSVGHPDKVADHIVAYLLDRYIERDRKVRFAMECQVKDNHVTLGGEVTSACAATPQEIDGWVREAVRDIGYTHEYAAAWGADSALDADALEIVQHIGQQSPDIAQGVDADGWGDQGIFWGMATDDLMFRQANDNHLPHDHALARRIGVRLYEYALGRKECDLGIDIKTQVTLDYSRVCDVVVAIPMRGTPDHINDLRRQVEDIVREITSFSSITINGTGAYVRHASQGDCGTTGRKLAVDFYGGNCRIGGGCPWGKDPSKADVALNLYARAKAVEALERYGCMTIQCAISCCIGKRDIRLTFYDGHNNTIFDTQEQRPASEIIEELGLYAPVYAAKNKNGLFA